jgi:hypothetical protein
MLSNLATRDIETLIHPYTNLASIRNTGPLVIDRGQGVFLYDSNGKSYIDGMAGLWCTALGHGNEELIEAATRQMRKLSFAHLFTAKSHDGPSSLPRKSRRLRRSRPPRFSSAIRARKQTTPGQARLVHEQRARAAASKRRSSAASRPITV